MAHDTKHTLDDRKASILRAVVEEYIETAQPVGSGRVARAVTVNVSSATVRNDMAVLEQEGYLFQPHTSAGRVPTEKGYRFFVDSLDGPIRLASGDAQQVRTFFAGAHGELERMLHDTSMLLSNLTQYAGVVIGPGHDVATIRSVQLVGLSPRIALVVVVLSNGTVEKHTLEFEDDVDEARLTSAAARLSALVVGKAPDEVAAVGTKADRADALLAGALDAVGGVAPVDRGVFIGGTALMTEAFDAIGTVREILRILEEQFVVVTLLRDVVDRGLNVAIGTETGMEPLADCAVVVAPYQVDGEPAGSIGVLGPARMHYPQALAAVAVVSQRLGRHLSEA
jgi:heat-inducible transcriptional repressor